MNGSKSLPTRPTGITMCLFKRFGINWMAAYHGKSLVCSFLEIAACTVRKLLTPAQGYEPIPGTLEKQGLRLPRGTHLAGA
jgi:hypothetical protein